jgi:hypothetical protein
MDDYEYNQNFEENKKDSDSNVEMKDLTEFDEESIKFREKMWGNNYLNKQKVYTGFNRQITISEKLKAIDYAKKHNSIEEAKKFNVNEGSIRYWEKNEKNYKKVDLPTKKITIHKLPSYYGIEERLLKYIETNRKLGNTILFIL